MRVRVTAGGRSVVVRLTDWMARDRLVDLSDDAFRRLAPLSVGLVRVEIP
jgi:rare lipoprotein A (peptidoglycan hydrolase)